MQGLSVPQGCRMKLGCVFRSSIYECRKSSQGFCLRWASCMRLCLYSRLSERGGRRGSTLPGAERSHREGGLQISTTFSEWPTKGLSCMIFVHWSGQALHDKCQHAPIPARLWMACYGIMQPLVLVLRCQQAEQGNGAGVW